MSASVFPLTAATDEEQHPAACVCGRCTDKLLARLARRLVLPAPLTDRALTPEGDSDEPRPER